MAESTLNTTVSGLAKNGSYWVCEHAVKYQRSRGIFLGDNPFSFTLPVLFIQTSIVSILTTVLQFILEPLGETSFFPQLLAGLLLGPSIIGQSEFVKKWIFPPKTFYISETIAFFGSMMYMFLIGVKLDLGIVIRSGKKAWAIGIFSFVMPIIMSTLTSLLLRNFLTLEPSVNKSLMPMAFIFSAGSFHVTAVHLSDLKLLNSEMGRLAISSSMVNGAFSLLWATSTATRIQTIVRKDNSFNWTNIAFFGMVVIIMCVLRPIMFWMIRHTPEGKPIKESYILSVFLMLLGSALFSEVIGEHFMVGPIILGVAVPGGPPLGSALSERLDTMVSTIFLPLYFLYSGASFNVFLIDKRSFLLVQLIAIVASLDKLKPNLLE